MPVPSTPPLPPGRTIGILGGGQLGRMLSLAAARLGLRCHVWCPEPEQPAAWVAAAATVAPYDDAATLTAFAAAVDLVTYEFENVPCHTAQALNRIVPVRPSPHALAVTQDRLSEKEFLRNAGILTAPFVPVDTAADLPTAIAEIGLPAVLKTRRFGYDGKGQFVLKAATDTQMAEAWAAVGGAPSILECYVGFAHEISAVVARGIDGATTCYDPVRNIHENHILARSIVPAGIPADVSAAVCATAEQIVRMLDYVGVMGVEMFLEAGAHPRLYVNELAPRVHNSGHWTADACVVGQFEQHIRAICGWPLGATARHSDAIMENLLGDAIEAWPVLARQPATAIHLYDKSGIQPGRKMGHVTRLYPLGYNPAALPDGASFTPFPAAAPGKKPAV
jgi:5-(carboxyamino)imidazole ribonucleotide synthase